MTTGFMNVEKRDDHARDDGLPVHRSRRAAHVADAADRHVPWQQWIGDAGQFPLL